MSKITRSTLGTLAVLLLALTVSSDAAYGQLGSSRRDQEGHSSLLKRKVERRSGAAMKRSRSATPRSNRSSSFKTARQPGTGLTSSKFNRSLRRGRPQETPKRPVVRKPITVKPKRPVVRKPITVKPKRPVVRKPITVKPKRPVVRKPITVKPKRPIVVTKPKPKPKRPIVVTKPKPKRPIVVTKPKPKRPIVVTKPKPKRPIVVTKPKPKRPIVVTKPKPKRPIVVTKPKPKRPIVVSKPRRPVVVTKPKRPIVCEPINPGCITPGSVIKPLFPIVPVPAPAPQASCAPPCGCSGSLHLNLGGLGFSIGGCNHGCFWVEPVYEVIQVEVWVAEATIEVWVEDVIGTYTDPCGNQHQIVVQPAGWRSVVIPGHFELRDERRIVTAGYWTSH